MIQRAAGWRRRRRVTCRRVTDRATRMMYLITWVRSWYRSAAVAVSRTSQWHRRCTLKDAKWQCVLETVCLRRTSVYHQQNCGVEHCAYQRCRQCLPYRWWRSLSPRPSLVVHHSPGRRRLMMCDWCGRLGIGRTDMKQTRRELNRWRRNDDEGSRAAADGWSTVSKAADRSRRARATTRPSSTVVIRSLWILTNAVLVQWNFRQADWIDENRLYWSACWVNLMSMICSRIFETKLRLEIGLKELRLDGSNVVFMTKGLTMAGFWLCANLF